MVLDGCKKCCRRPEFFIVSNCWGGVSELSGINESCEVVCAFSVLSGYPIGYRIDFDTDISARLSQLIVVESVPACCCQKSTEKSKNETKAQL